MWNISVIAVLTLTLLASGCTRPQSEKPRDFKGIAEAQSQLAATPEQARLWKEAVEKASESGLERAPLVERPVTSRQRVAAPNRAAEGKQVQLPKELVTGIRIVSAPAVVEDQFSFSGAAVVVRAEGEQLELDLGQGRMLRLVARARGGPLRAKVGEKTQVDYRVRGDPFERHSILALRMENGDGVVSVLESGSKPVMVPVPLFDLSAMQVGKPDKNTMNVEVRVGRERKVLAQGQIAEFLGSRLSVGLVTSIAFTGADLHRIEGNPYAIQLVAWPTP